MKKALFLSAVFATCGTLASAQPLPVASEQYEWSSVPIVGGGGVDGIICHPTVKDVRYCRTDMGGAYRWDAQKKEWIPILDWIPLSEANLQGVESIAIDPKQPNRIYMMCGTYTSQKGSVLRSDNGGQTYLRTDVPVAMGGNENGRGNGERLMIDPVNTDIVYMGTRQDGLWRTQNAGKNWERVVSFPDVSEKIDPSNRRAFWNRGSGIIAVVFDTNNATDKKCMNIYAAASIMGRESIFASHDGGETWNSVEGQPTNLRPTHMVLASDGSTWIWTPERQKAYYTTDKGATWTACKGLPDNTRVIADKENPLRFYALDIRNKMLYSSIDGGRSFKGDTLNINLQQGHRGDNRGGQDRVYAVPGYEGDLWIAAYDGLYHTNINNLQLELKSQVRTIYAFGLGKAKEGSAYPTIYIIGVVNGQYGFFRSDDVAQSWVRINDDMHQYGLVLHIIGDWQEFGRVYVGTHGRGIITGKKM